MCVKQIRASLADASPKPGIIYEVLKAIFNVFLYVWLNASMNLVSYASVSERQEGFVCIRVYNITYSAFRTWVALNKVLSVLQLINTT